LCNGECEREDLGVVPNWWEIGVFGEQGRQLIIYYQRARNSG